MKRILFTLMLFMVIPSIGHAQRLQWEKDYFVDEFNEPNLNMPFYTLALLADNSDQIVIRVSRQRGIEILHRDYYCNYKLKFKLANGKIVDVPVIKLADQITKVEDPWTVVEIMSQGNYAMSLLCYDALTDELDRTVVVRVKRQTQSIKQILNKLGVQL